MTDVAIRLPVLHPGQLRVQLSKAKRKVLILGRRWGKTTFVASEAVERLLAGGGVLYAAPKSDQTDTFWEMLTRQHGPPGRRRPGFLEEAIAAGLIYKNETKRVLRGEANGWGQIVAKTAYDADTLRSGAADLLILDEWPLMHPSAWESVGAPMLMDSGGDAYFVGTPKRQNHGATYFARGLQDKTGYWASFTGPSYENPHLDAEALSMLTADMTDDMIRQEINAEFLDNEGAVFKLRDEGFYPGPADPADHAGHRIVAGVDWGKTTDYTATSVLCVECKQELAIERMNGMEYRLQRPMLQEIWQRWGVREVHPEENSMGGPNVEELRHDLSGTAIEVFPFTMSATSKPPLIESLVLAMDKAEYRWLDDAVARAELKAYERKVSPVTGRTSYSAPSGVHDDTVIARALANRAAFAPTLWIRSLS